jgi:membrane protease subunit HflC
MKRAAGPDTTPRAASNRSLMRTALLLGMLPALLVWLLLASLFTVDVTQHGVVTRFGRLVRVVSEPGLHLKAPFDRMIGLDRRLTYSRPAPAEYLTLDKRNVMIESVATWRIGDPERYLATLSSRADADVRMADALLGEIGAVVGTSRSPRSSRPTATRHDSMRSSRRFVSVWQATRVPRWASRSSRYSFCT